VNFDFLMPTRVVFGRGRITEVGPLALALGRSALVVTGRESARRSGALQRTCESLIAAGVQVQVFDGVSANPMSDEVDAATALVRRHSCDIVVGLGGGSALDATKACAVSLNAASVRELIGRNVAQSATSLPIIAIPTTAGTGSEVTRGAIIQDTVSGFKSGVRGNSLFPRVAIVDPDLIAGIPVPIALETAFDAFTHAMESYVCRGATPVTDLFAEKAIRLLAQHWRGLTDPAVQPQTHDVLCLAATLGGINVGNTGTCLPHRLQQAMASVTRLRVSHGRGLAALYPAWLRRARVHAPERFARVASWLTDGRSCDAEREVGALIRAMGLADSMGALGFVAEDAEHVCANISGNLANDPIDGLNAAAIRCIVCDAIGLSNDANRREIEAQ
jgi:alcohol dehydrogenase class IV